MKPSRSAPRQSLLWITDPWETLDHPRDTTLRLIEECLLRGHSCYWATPSQITLLEHRTRIHARQVLEVAPGRAKKGFRLSQGTQYTVQDFHQVFYRTDPPVDAHYLDPLALLLRAIPRGKPRIHAPPELLFMKSEKVLPPELEAFAPRSLVASRWEDLHAYGTRLGTTVAKPLHSAQSKGVEKLEWRTEAERSHAHEVLAALTGQFQVPVLLQEYLPGIENGETRIWYVGGRFLACARKVSAPGTFRIDMDQGGTLAPHTLTEREKKVSLATGRSLSKAGVLMAAVDLIDGKITDLNFTSPGLLVPMEALAGKNLAQEICRAIELQ